MSWSFTAHRGSVNSKVAGTVLTVAPSANVAAGAVLVAVCASDNVVTGGGLTRTHVVADFLGNPWQKVLEWSNAAAAAAGITASVWVCRVKNALTTTDPVVFGVSASAAARCVGLYQYAVAAGNTFKVREAVGSEQDNTQSPTVSMAGLPANTQYAFFGVVARETDTLGTYTPANGWNDRTKFGTTGGTGNTNVSCVVNDRVATATGGTFNPTALSVASDVVTLAVALEEVPLRGALLTFADCTASQLRTRVRSLYQTAGPVELARLAAWIEAQSFTDAELIALFGVEASQVPALRARLGNQAALYESLLSQGGQ